MLAFEAQPQPSERGLPRNREERTEREMHKLPRLRFPSDDGKLMTCPHPEISADAMTHEYQEGDFVDVVTEDDTDPVRMRFETYLTIIGVPYARYFREMKKQQSARGSTDQGEMLKKLHQEIIDYRTAEALTLKKSYTRQEARRTNYQEVTTNEDGQFFLKLFNDLNIDGLRAETSMAREDYLDGIDEFLVFDTEALGGDESGGGAHELYIAIQRSFDDKRDAVRRDRWRAIPERSSLLEIPRVALHERFAEYGRDDAGHGSSYWQKLLDLRTDEAAASGTRPKEQRLPSVYRAFSENKTEGRRLWMERASHILHSVRKEIAGYMDHERQDEHRERLQSYLEAVDAALGQVTSDTETGAVRAA